MKSLFTIALVCTSIPTQAAFTDFSDLTVGDTFAAGDRIESLGISFDVVQFLSQSEPANVADAGFIFPSPSLGPGMGLEFVLDTDVQRIALNYLLSGPTNGIMVNGVSTSTPNKFSDQDGISLGGVSITANTFPNINGEKGELILTGPINSFVIGGLELVIDDVSITVPEPATAAMFATTVMLLLSARLSAVGRVRD